MENLFLSTQALITTLAVVIFVLLVLSADDELEQYAVSKAIKLSSIITILSLVGYGFYMLSIGYKTVSVKAIFFGIIELSVLTCILYHLELNGINFSLKIKNKMVENILIGISIALSILTTISLTFKFKLFENNKGIIRYDEIILYINAILLSCIIPLFPRKKEKLSREEHKKREKQLNKEFNVIYIIYGVFMVGGIAYAIYKKVTL